VESTRFHPTFAYEMLWNFASAGLLLWLSRRYKEGLKPGTIFAGWLVLAGVGRVIIEFFRPDQPKIASLGISYTSIFAALMAIVGAVLLLGRYKAIHLKFAENWEEEYQRSNPENPIDEKPILQEVSVRKPVQRESALLRQAKTKIAARKAADESNNTANAKKTS